MQNPLPAPASFADVLHARTQAYFGAQPRRQYATPLFYAKSLLLLLLYGGAYYLLLTATTLPQLLAAASVLGVCHVFIPLNLSHDAIHGAVSSRPWLNELLALGFELTGCSSFMYKRKHLEAHRNKENGSKQMTIESQQLLLQSGGAAGTVNLHPIFYLFYAQYMIFVRDFSLFYQERTTIPTAAWAKLWIFKAAYYLTFVIIPFAVIEAAWWQVLLALLLMYLIVSLVGIVILLMPTEKMENARQQAGSPNEQWIREILEHNVDFSPELPIVNLLTGGANMNVIHYLFPDVCHVHYHPLASIVKQTATEFGLLYREQRVRDVFGIHFNYIININAK